MVYGLNTVPEHAFGYSNPYDNKGRIKPMAVTYNTMNVLGYFPFIGNIIGLARIIFSFLMLLETQDKDNDNLKTFFIFQMWRGLYEQVFVLGGISLLIYDLWTEHRRNYHSSFN